MVNRLWHTRTTTCTEITALWDVMSFILVEMYRRFGETSHPLPSTGHCRENLKSHDIYELSIIFCRKADGNWKTQM